MTRNFYYFLVLFISFTLCSGTIAAQGEKFRVHTPMSDRITGYYENLPLDYDASSEKKYPLFIFLHGTGATGNGSFEHLQYLYSNLWGGVIWRLHDQAYYGPFPTSFTVNGETHEFIYIAPQFDADPFFSGFDWRPQIDNMLDYCIANYNVDTNRIYLVGQSMGAGYVMGYISSTDTRAKRIAAAAMASANMKIGENIRGDLLKGDVLNRSRVGTFFIGSLEDSAIGGSDFVARQWIQIIVDSIMAATPQPSGMYVPTVKIIPTGGHGRAAAEMCNPAVKVAALNGDSINMYQWLLQFNRLSLVPVTGLEVSARSSGNSVIVHWSTLSEHGSSTYEVERRGESGDFKSIYRTASQNSSMGAQYAYTDHNPLPGVNNYRIKQIDQDGRTAYSKVATVKFVSAVALKVYPNPASSRITLEVATGERIHSVKIYDQAGKLHRELSGSKTSREDINISSLPKGAYIGKIISDSGSTDFTFIKK